MDEALFKGAFLYKKQDTLKEYPVICVSLITSKRLRT